MNQFFWQQFTTAFVKTIVSKEKSKVIVSYHGLIPKFVFFSMSNFCTISPEHYTQSALILKDRN